MLLFRHFHVFFLYVPLTHIIAFHGVELHNLTLKGRCIIFCNIYIYIHTHSNEIHNVVALIVY